MTPTHRRLSQIPAMERRAYLEHGAELWEIVRRAEAHGGHRLGPGRVRRITDLSERRAARLRCFVEVHGPPWLLAERGDDPVVLYCASWSEWGADSRESRSAAVWGLLEAAPPESVAVPPSAFSAAPKPVSTAVPVFPERGQATGRIHLIIGDAHATPGEDRWRFKALGRMVRSLAAEGDLAVIEMGDWYDMHSLSSYDRGTVHAEGRRVLDDIQAGTDALHTLLDAAGGAAFEAHRCEGNHGERARRFMSQNPATVGLLDRYDHAFSDAGWDVSPFLRPIHLDGIDYSHFFHGSSGRAFAAKYLGAQLLRERHASSVVGHSHRLDVALDPGARLLGISAGCYTDAAPGYAGQSAGAWWRGIVVLRDVDDGYADVETYSLARIRALWG